MRGAGDNGEVDMSAKTILIPDKFQEQIDDYTGKAETVGGLEYTVEAGDVSLASIEKYEECITEMNDTLALFSQLAALDGETMKQIKAAWMNADGENARKTVAEIVTGAAKDAFGID